MSMTRLTDIAKAILVNANALEQYFNSNELPYPSFDEYMPAELPLSPEMRQHRQKAVDLATELRDLLVGPAMLLRPVLNGTSLQAIYKYNIASKVPLDGQISFYDLAVATGLKLSNLQRILRFAMIHHRVFQENKSGMVSHTAASRLLTASPGAMAGLGFMFDEAYQSFASTVEAMEADDSPEPNKCGWALAHKSSVPLWEYHAAHPELGKRAALAMEGFTKGLNMDTAALTRDYDWSALSQGLIVDLGGANGHVAIELARANPGMRCIVQDIPEVMATARYQVPEDVADRVTFAAHDFFQPQPVVAQAYVFRQIFHNWSNEYCIKILRALIPALKRGAKVVINDNIIPRPGTLPPMQERAVRSMDMIMLSLFNSQEREEEDWISLFEDADPRFQNVRAWQPASSQLGLIEATWNG